MLSYGIVCMILGIAVTVERTQPCDGQTDDKSIYLASIASRGKNVCYCDDVIYNSIFKLHLNNIIAMCHI